MARIDFDKVAADYDTGRAIALAGLDGWRRAVERYVPPRSGLPIVDIGCGTGQFALAFTTWFDVDVIGVEPSTAMLAEAEKKAHPRVRYLLGRAEALPLPDASAGAAWLSTVLHHVGDLRGAARETRRVLDRGAPVLIRGVFPGRCDRVTLFRFFPAARKIIDTYPSVDATTTLRSISDADFAAGLAAIDVAVEAETQEQAIVDELDLLVLEPTD